eukprot:Unigene2892_Nuclearia_a/m.8917 Unigene2892_Nuclearia_a/g.8917  ORF Unigene2892_Nuclearia_a/g.8917 Unigene2892_Nuclearia_a/m.8917 type:complete len:432 (+) Unigene2892_Nuclearia_a:735-2030(+)
MYEPALQRIVYHADMDPSTRMWLQQELFMDTRRSSGNYSPCIRRASTTGVRRSRVSGQMRLPDSLLDRLRARAEMAVPAEIIEPPLQQLMSSLNLTSYADADAESLLRSLRTRQFDVWAHSEPELLRLLLLMFFDLQLIDDCNISPLALWGFLRAVHGSYKETNPYHNFRHAFDVAQGVFMFLHHDDMRSHLSPVETLALIIAAVCHDVAHPGTTNNFLIATRSPLALLYNDSSVLESFHCSQTFQLLLQEGGKHDILASLSPEDYRAARAVIIKGIMATDLSRHMDMLTRVNLCADQFTWDEPAHQQLVYELLVKCADVSNPLRPAHIAKSWSDMVQQEFFLQGDKERELGLTISPFMDRTNPNQPRMALSFLDYIVLPLYQHATRVLPFMGTMLPPLRASRAMWDALVAKSERTADAGIPRGDTPAQSA